MNVDVFVYIVDEQSLSPEHRQRAVAREGEYLDTKYHFNLELFD